MHDFSPGSAAAEEIHHHLEIKMQLVLNLRHVTL